jgi:peroxiredoxin
LRDAYPQLRERGAEVFAVGTGGRRMAAGFVEDYEIPYPVLLDDDARAARAAELRKIGFFQMFDPATFPGTARALRAGHRIGMAGKRVTQLGSTFVFAPGDELRYQHRDRHSADHAPLDEILSALRN